MKNDFLENITEYKIIMNIFDNMLNNGVISKEDYIEIDTKVSEKYQICSCSIYRYCA